MTDRSKTRIFKVIELDNIKDLKTGLTITADRLIEKYIRVVAPSGQIIKNIPTTVVLGNDLEAKEISLLPDNSIQVDYTDFYDLSCIITANSSGQNVLNVWAESTTNNGVTWDIFPLSGRRQSFSNNNEGDVEYSTKVTLPQGFRFRFRAKSDSGSITLGASETIDTGNGVVEIPAVVLSIARI